MMKRNATFFRVQTITYMHREVKWIVTLPHNSNNLTCVGVGKCTFISWTDISGILYARSRSTRRNAIIHAYIQIVTFSSKYLTIYDWQPGQASACTTLDFVCFVQSLAELSLIGQIVITQPNNKILPEIFACSLPRQPEIHVATTGLLLD